MILKESAKDIANAFTKWNLWKGGGSGGSTVTITPTLTEGEKIADYTIDDTSGELFAPSGSGTRKYGVPVTVFSDYTTNQQNAGDISGSGTISGSNLSIKHIEFLFAYRSNSDTNIHRMLPSNKLKYDYSQISCIERIPTYQYLYSRTAYCDTIWTTQTTSNSYTIHFGGSVTNGTRQSWGTSTETSASTYLKLVEVIVYCDIDS